MTDPQLEALQRDLRSAIDHGGLLTPQALKQAHDVVVDTLRARALYRQCLGEHAATCATHSNGHLKNFGNIKCDCPRAAFVTVVTGW